MLRGNAIAWALALICCALGPGTAVAAQGGCARAAAVAETNTLEEASDSVLCLINGERAGRGLAPLVVSRLLSTSAQRHSRDMVARHYFSHVSRNGTSPCRRILRAGYLHARNGCTVGETIAWGSADQSTPADLVRSLMNSSGHRRVVLDGRYRDVGVGLAIGAPIAGIGDGATLTLDFGRR